MTTGDMQLVDGLYVSTSILVHCWWPTTVDILLRLSSETANSKQLIDERFMLLTTVNSCLRAVLSGQVNVDCLLLTVYSVRRPRSC